MGFHTYQTTSLREAAKFCDYWAIDSDTVTERYVNFEVKTIQAI
jgi:hypothetical protein